MNKEKKEKKSSSEEAEKIFKTESRIFCIGLIIHLLMFVTGEYSDPHEKHKKP